MTGTSTTTAISISTSPTMATIAPTVVLGVALEDVAEAVGAVEADEAEQYSINEVVVNVLDH